MKHSTYAPADRRRRLHYLVALGFAATAAIPATVACADMVPFDGVSAMLDVSRSMVASDLPKTQNIYGSVRAVRWSTDQSLPDSGAVPLTAPADDYYLNANCASYTSMFLTAALHNSGFEQRNVPGSLGPIAPNDSVFIIALSAQAETDATGVVSSGGYGPNPGDYLNYFVMETVVPVNDLPGAPVAGFVRVPTVQDLQTGDFLAVRHNTTCDANGFDCSGHMATVVSPPVALPQRTGRTYWNNVLCDEYKVRILDVTSSAHGDQKVRNTQGEVLADRDTRVIVNLDGTLNEKRSGIGEGTMILCATPGTGEIVGHRWSFSSSDTYSNTDGNTYSNGKSARTIVAGRLTIEE